MEVICYQTRIQLDIYRFSSFSKYKTEIQFQHTDIVRKNYVSQKNSNLQKSLILQSITADS